MGFHTNFQQLETVKCYVNCLSEGEQAWCTVSSSWTPLPNDNINNFSFLFYKHYSSEVEQALLTNFIKITQTNPISTQSPLLLATHIG